MGSNIKVLSNVMLELGIEKCEDGTVKYEKKN